MSANVLDHERLQLKVGDKLRLTLPKDDDGFLNSYVGKKFEAGIIDEVTAEVQQRPSLEIVFILTAKKDGNDVTNAQFFSDPAEGDEKWDERGDFRFACYMINKGAVKL